MTEREFKKLGPKDDWAAIACLLTFSTGVIVIIFDFWKIQHLSFQINFSAIIGFLLLILGVPLRVASRKKLRKAGFNLLSSSRLQIVKNHQLITNGIYKYIRHPLYLGGITRNIGLALLFSSIYGLVAMIFCNVFYLFRIQVEERMLINEFGNEYKEYRKRTRKIIPYLYRGK